MDITIKKSNILETARQRILYFIGKEGVRPADFLKKTGLKKGFIDRSHQDSGASDLHLSKILEAYPNLSAEWLITGKGEMFKSENSRESGVQIIHKSKYYEPYCSEDIPLYDIDAVAGLNMLFPENIENIIDFIRIPNLPKCDGAIYIRGDSMYPLLKSGDIVIFKLINNIDYIFYGEMYILAFNLNGDEHLTVKFINKSDKEDHVRLVSQNSYHAPIDIPISSIQTLALVKASVRINAMK